MIILLLAVKSSVAGDALWGIIQHCLRPADEGYCITCRAPLSSANCPASSSCLTSTKMWDLTDSYLTILDRKACGCPPSFVHGLALPLRRTVGIEDPTKPDGIWTYAWEQARNRISEESAIALVVNSAEFRSENQLHVHLVRLREDARTAVRSKAVEIASLNNVWDEAHKRAMEIGIGDVYGILIIRGADSQFLMLVENTALERVYTENECNR